MNLAHVNWNQVKKDLEQHGWAQLGQVLSAKECDTWVEKYDQNQDFRKTVVMQRHGYGQGEYRYLNHPLPQPLDQVRQTLYEELRDTAQSWNSHLKWELEFPPSYSAFLELCNQSGQYLATPLILKYHKGDFNCLHQDKYGDVIFPFQMVCLLSDSSDFQGGTFVLTKQKARQQAKVDIVHLQRGEAAIFSVFEMPVLGQRGWSKCAMKHGVSTVTEGNRFTLGVILHEAKT